MLVEYFKSILIYIYKNTKDIIFFPIIPMGAIRQNCPILPAKDIRLLGNFSPIALKLRD